jgi:hypothetical protein
MPVAAGSRTIAPPQVGSAHAGTRPSGGPLDHHPLGTQGQSAPHLKQIAMTTGENYTAGHSIFTKPNLIGRADVSPAREVQIVRAQVTVQPAKKAQKNPVVSLVICLSACVTATRPPGSGGSRRSN